MSAGNETMGRIRVRDLSTLTSGTSVNLIAANNAPKPQAQPCPINFYNAISATTTAVSNSGPTQLQSQIQGNYHSNMYGVQGVQNSVPSMDNSSNTFKLRPQPPHQDGLSNGPITLQSNDKSPIQIRPATYGRVTLAPPPAYTPRNTTTVNNHERDLRTMSIQSVLRNLTPEELTRAREVIAQRNNTGRNPSTTQPNTFVSNQQNIVSENGYPGSHQIHRVAAVENRENTKGPPPPYVGPKPLSPRNILPAPPKITQPVMKQTPVPVINSSLEADIPLIDLDDSPPENPPAQQSPLQNKTPTIRFAVVSKPANLANMNKRNLTDPMVNQRNNPRLSSMLTPNITTVAPTSRPAPTIVYNNITMKPGNTPSQIASNGIVTAPQNKPFVVNANTNNANLPVNTTNLPSQNLVTVLGAPPSQNYQLVNMGTPSNYMMTPYSVVDNSLPQVVQSFSMAKMPFSASGNQTVAPDVGNSLIVVSPVASAIPTTQSTFPAMLQGGPSIAPKVGDVPCNIIKLNDHYYVQGNSEKPILVGMKTKNASTLNVANVQNNADDNSGLPRISDCRSLNVPKQKEPPNIAPTNTKVTSYNLGVFGGTTITVSHPVVTTSTTTQSTTSNNSMKFFGGSATASPVVSKSTTQPSTPNNFMAFFGGSAANVSPVVPTSTSQSSMATVRTSASNDPNSFKDYEKRNKKKKRRKSEREDGRSEKNRKSSKESVIVPQVENNFFFLKPFGGRDTLSESIDRVATATAESDSNEVTCPSTDLTEPSPRHSTTPMLEIKAELSEVRPSPSENSYKVHRLKKCSVVLKRLKASDIAAYQNREPVETTAVDDLTRTTDEMIDLQSVIERRLDAPSSTDRNITPDDAIIQEKIHPQKITRRTSVEKRVESPVPSRLINCEESIRSCSINKSHVEKTSDDRSVTSSKSVIDNTNVIGKIDRTKPRLSTEKNDQVASMITGAVAKTYSDKKKRDASRNRIKPFKTYGDKKGHGEIKPMNIPENHPPISGTEKSDVPQEKHNGQDDSSKMSDYPPSLEIIEPTRKSQDQPKRHDDCQINNSNDKRRVGSILIRRTVSRHIEESSMKRKKKKVRFASPEKCENFDKFENVGFASPEKCDNFDKSENVFASPKKSENFDKFENVRSASPEKCENFDKFENVMRAMRSLKDIQCVKCHETVAIDEVWLNPKSLDIVCIRCLQEVRPSPKRRKRIRENNNDDDSDPEIVENSDISVNKPRLKRKRRIVSDSD